MVGKGRVAGCGLRDAGNDSLAADARSGEDVSAGVERLSLRRVFAGLGVFGAAIVLAVGLALFAPAQMPPPGWAPGGSGGAGGGSGTVSSGTATQVAKYTAETTVGSQSTATFQANGQLYVQGSAANDAMVFGSSSASNGQGIWGRNSASGGVGLVGEGTHTGAIPFQVRAPASVTADLTQWLVNGSPVASVDAAGVGDFTGLSIAGTPIGAPEITDDETFANEPGACSPGDEFYPTDNPNLRGYCPTADTWKYLSKGLQVTPPPSTGWAFVNQASSTATSSNGMVKFTTPASGTVSASAYCRSPVTSINGDFRFLVFDDTSDQPPGVNAPTDFGAGIAFRESATGKIVDFRSFCDSGGCGVNNSKWTNATTFAAAYTGFQAGQWSTEWHTRDAMGLRLDLSDSTNIVFYWSPDSGASWEQFDTRTKTDFFTTAPDEICLLNYANGARVINYAISYTGN